MLTMQYRCDAQAIKILLAITQGRPLSFPSRIKVLHFPMKNFGKLPNGIVGKVFNPSGHHESQRIPYATNAKTAMRKDHMTVLGVGGNACGGLPQQRGEGRNLAMG
jgi:hypothetical protein